MSELLATESCKKFIKNPENQKVMTDLAIGFGKIEEKDKEKFQKAASIAFDLLSEGQDTKISDIPDMLADKGLIAKDSTEMKILTAVLKSVPNLTVKDALDYALKNSKAFASLSDSAKPLLEELGKKDIDIKSVLKCAADLLEARAKGEIFGDFLGDKAKTKKMLNDINGILNSSDFIIRTGVSGAINNSIVDGMGSLPVVLRRIADTKDNVDVTKALVGLGTLATANKHAVKTKSNYIFIDVQDLEIFKSGFENGGISELKDKIKDAELGWKYPDKDLKNIYFPKDVELTNFKNSYIQGVTILDAIFKGANFDGAYFFKSKIENSKLEGGDSKSVVFSGAEFEKATLKDIKFQANSNVGAKETKHSVKFTGSTLDNVTFENFNFDKFECDKSIKVTKLEFIGGNLVKST